MYILMCPYVYVLVYTYIQTVCMYAYMHIYMYVYVYICVYILSALKGLATQCSEVDHGKVFNSTALARLAKESWQKLQ